MTATTDFWNIQLDWAGKPFTYKYSQPDDYHYSLDSIEFMWRLGLSLRGRNEFSNLRVLDLCAGCGVLGFDLHFWIGNKIDSCDFIEVQPAFRQHFSKNLEITGCDPQRFLFHLLNYKLLPSAVDFKGAFDVIVCNPPYFRHESGSLSQSGFRNRCHFLLDGTFAELCNAIFFSLSERGEAYVLLKDLSAQGVDQLDEMKEHAAGNFIIDMLCRVRGTPVIKIRHK